MKRLIWLIFPPARGQISQGVNLRWELQQREYFSWIFLVQHKYKFEPLERSHGMHGGVSKGNSRRYELVCRSLFIGSRTDWIFAYYNHRNDWIGLPRSLPMPCFVFIIYFTGIVEVTNSETLFDLFRFSLLSGSSAIPVDNFSSI